MSDPKTPMARAAERAKARRIALEAEAHERGIQDVQGFVRAALELENGPSDADDMPDDPFLPAGHSLQ
ncbi:hypothetical protein KXR63_08065 [Stutzerimonas chloritidismutans]|uniref:hypothetical protein n=1 Tax=Stutzerimonas chloritidismutans TaxID=203192 RepID=UPI003F183810